MFGVYSFGTFFTLLVTITSGATYITPLPPPQTDTDRSLLGLKDRSDHQSVIKTVSRSIKIIVLQTQKYIKRWSVANRQTVGSTLLNWLDIACNMTGVSGNGRSLDLLMDWDVLKAWWTRVAYGYMGCAAGESLGIHFLVAGTPSRERRKIMREWRRYTLRVIGWSPIILLNIYFSYLKYFISQGKTRSWDFSLLFARGPPLRVLELLKNLKGSTPLSKMDSQLLRKDKEDLKRELYGNEIFAPSLPGLYFLTPSPWGWVHRAASAWQQLPPAGLCSYLFPLRMGA